ncbi:MAG: hypothetical protein H7X80_05890, partial [bacterium]|nr:hypothetical protein [Candidatus Kapabacteria bacterium]
MPHGAILLCILALLPLLTGCFAITRTETDLYTITIRDTTIREDAVNPPGEREGGTIYPSPRSVDISRRYLQRDSVDNRYYPAYLRFGGIEAMSFFSPGTETAGAGNGLFGLFDLMTVRLTSDSSLFGGYFYRIMPYEARLRWFDDAPNWTLGTGAEIFIRKLDSSSRLNPGEYLFSILNGYLRHRIFLREEAPYVMVVPYLGLSAFPSQYVNGGATLDVGSYGGFNVRAYAGYVHGTSSYFATGGRDTADYSASFPYFGIGVSALDFVNKTEELFIEWKDHDHNALEVSALNLDLVHSFGADDAFAGDTTTGEIPAVSGFHLRIGTATYPLPFLNNRFFVGTSLLSFYALSGSELAYG